jgi:hypothetical protein
LFPEPVATIAAGRIWLREDIEEWAAANDAGLSTSMNERRQA